MLNNRMYRISVFYSPIPGRKWSTGKTKTSWGYIRQFTIGPFWILFDRYYDYDQAYGIGDAS